MKLFLGLAPSFSEALFNWNAVAPLGGRGEVVVRWRDKDGHQERKRQRWKHPFDQGMILEAAAVLDGLPERFGPGMDDAGSFHIGYDKSGNVVLRSLVCWPEFPDDASRAFYDLWGKLVVPVERCLIELGAPVRLITTNRLGWVAK